MGGGRRMDDHALGNPGRTSAGGLTRNFSHELCNNFEPVRRGDGGTAST